MLPNTTRPECEGPVIWYLHLMYCPVPSLVGLISAAAIVAEYQPAGSGS